jgi:hypothetical protein
MGQHPPPFITKPRIVGSRDAATYLGTTDEALRQQRYAGTLPGSLSYKSGGRVVYDVRDLDDYLDSQKALARIETAARVERRTA